MASRRCGSPCTTRSRQDGGHEHCARLIIVAVTFGASLVTGVLFTRQGGRSVQDFFLSGRQLPWWLAGTSMVATTFAADTPLAVAGIVARQGIAGNWIWWSAAAGSMMTVFLFARLWRRAGIVTDVELAELRYHGRPAAALRVFRALYLGLPINCVIMGWVNLAMGKVLSVMLGWDELTAVLVSLALTGVYAAMAGLWGVVVTDFLQFIAMGGTIALAVRGAGAGRGRARRPGPPGSRGHAGLRARFLVRRQRRGLALGRRLPHLSRRAVVGELVSRSGTRRRRLRRAADDVGAHRA
jgi:hypothetical protein